MANADNPRIEELKKRVEKDPTSIAFAQLAEEYRRTGAHQMAVDVCRDGLSRHPGYVSARVTLARALMELDEYTDAQRELYAVLTVAPDNLAAIRALADIHQKVGDSDHLSIDVAAQMPELDDLPIVPEPAAPKPPPSLDALDALDPVGSLDSVPLALPPLPEMNWDFDASLQLEPSEPGGPSAPAAPLAPVEPTEPALEQLEGWLDAILADRAR